MSRIEYDLTKIKGIVFDVDGVLSPSTVPIAENGMPLRMGNVKDGYALQLAVKQGLRIAVITGGKSESVGRRLDILGIRDVWQGVANKLPVLKRWMEEQALHPGEVAYMGDDIPDLQCMRHVGLPCCPFDAAWEVKQESVYISPLTGGYGAVRDVVQQMLMANGLWETDSDKSIIW